MNQKKSISYPYVASLDRTKQIKENWRKIKLKMSSKEVTSLLGFPDEERPLYTTQTKKAKPIGKTYWYLIQRLQENGSQDDKDEKLVRISLGIDDKVIAIDQWGLD